MCYNILHYVYLYCIYSVASYCTKIQPFSGSDLKKRRRSQSQQANALQSDDSHSLDVQAGEHLWTCRWWTFRVVFLFSKIRMPFLDTPNCPCLYSILVYFITMCFRSIFGGPTILSRQCLVPWWFSVASSQPYRWNTGYRGAKGRDGGSLGPSLKRTVPSSHLIS